MRLASCLLLLVLAAASQGQGKLLPGWQTSVTSEGGHEYAKGSTELIVRFFKERTAKAR